MRHANSAGQSVTAENAQLPMYPLLNRDQGSAIATAWSQDSERLEYHHLYLRGWHYQERGRSDAALRAFQELLSLSRQGNHRGWINAAEQAIADLTSTTATNTTSASGPESVSCGDWPAAEQCYQASQLFERGHWLPAIRQYKQALALATQTQQPIAMGRCLNGLGLIYLALQRYGRAETRLQAAVAVLVDRSPSVESAIALHNLGVAHYGQGHYQIAQSCFEEALQHWQTTEDGLGIALTLDYLGRTFARGQDAWLALGSFEAAADVLHALAEHQDVRVELAALLGQMAALCEASKHDDLAIAYWSAALEIYQTLSETAPQIVIWQQLSHLHQRLGQTAIARGYCQRLLTACVS